MDFSPLARKIEAVLSKELSPAADQTKAALRKDADGKPYETVDIEQSVEQTLQAIAPVIVEHLAEQVDDGRVRNEHVCPTCGEPMKFAQKRTRRLGFLFGIVTVKRAWFHCKRCQKGQAPLERVWGLQSGNAAMGKRLLTPHAQAQLITLCASTAYKEAKEHFVRLTGVAVSAMTGWRYTQRCGQQLRKEEEASPTGVPFRAGGGAG